MMQWLWFTWKIISKVKQLVVLGQISQKKSSVYNYAYRPMIRYIYVCSINILGWKLKSEFTYFCDRMFASLKRDEGEDDSIKMYPFIIKHLAFFLRNIELGTQVAVGIAKLEKKNPANFMQNVDLLVVEKALTSQLTDFFLFHFSFQVRDFERNK
ncbi:hypothetical protein BDF20DRAFT_430148 [Mycotypha africana]|uniref:uncharacterized protein n=1 Tax=Mycotypha africana TaxID=64632 RepID=UPI0023007429|nr:uncharacterized protein BDF20DRAFT_430148 [Mycotypha africana]KAI8981821.1 hypothetical protein BDF20DRAFT_430148 [Mycotypha africana]